MDIMSATDEGSPNEETRGANVNDDGDEVPSPQIVTQEGSSSESSSRIVFGPSPHGKENSIKRHEHPLFSEPTTGRRQPRQRQRRRQYSTPRAGSGITAVDDELDELQPVSMMGPILRRKKVVSMPLGAGGDFFVHDDLGGPHRQLEHLHDHHEQRAKQLSHDDAAAAAAGRNHLVRQKQVTPTTPTSSPNRRRKKQGSFMDNLVRRKQISLDLLGPNDFFAAPEEFEYDEAGGSEDLSTQLLPSPSTAEDFGGGDIEALSEKDQELVEAEEDFAPKPKKEMKLFLPLRFSPPIIIGHKRRGAGGHHGAGGAGSAAPPPEQTSTTDPPAASAAFINHMPTIDEETSEALARQSMQSEKLKLQLSSLRNKINEEEDEKKRELLVSVSDQILETHKALEEDHQVLSAKFKPKDEAEAAAATASAAATSELGEIKEMNSEDEDEIKKPGEEQEDQDELKNSLAVDYEDDGIVRATKADKIKTGILFAIMLAFTVTVCVWPTHIGQEVHIYDPVGLACVTDCPGNLETRDFFLGHNSFYTGQVIELIMHVDPNVDAGNAMAVVEIIGVGHNVTGHGGASQGQLRTLEESSNETGTVKAVEKIGPVNPELRSSFKEKILVDFEDPEEAHIINVYSTDPNVEISFTLLAAVRKPLSNYSVWVAALIMILVYAFILVEVIHRTLVAIFGSMLALLFLFIMAGGETESIQQVMLFMEWSTLGLLFGMMLLVGELSHTGIFEWCAVRLLMASKGSFSLLLVLLCTLTAVASAFLDNVTTMLLVAPVTIDMCNILGVDPRPYLISEVLLSNVGGTATLIGDPPNIIIGTSYSEIDFVGFITNTLPAIFILIVPATLLLVLRIYRYYFTSSKMCILDTDMLKRTYPIYDQPRLMIAGTVTFFVILIFFLHSVHHKDTAWVALFGAFITISFTNPHDVQDALRNHVEWDTLLFFAGLFVLVEACAAMGLLEAIGNALASYIESQPEDTQLSIAITLVIWVSAIVSAFLDNIPYTATMIPVVQILADKLDTLSLTTLAWALSFGACLGGNGTLLGASANIVTVGISKNKGYDISFLNFLYPGMLVMILSVAIANVYMLVRYSWL